MTKKHEFTRGSLVQYRNSIFRHRRAATLQPLRPIVMVTSVSDTKFKGTVITGPFAGDQIEEAVLDFSLLRDHVEIILKQPSKEKKPGDIVASEAGIHVVVSSVDTIPASKLFAGTVLAPAADTYLHQFSQHWHDDDFHIVRRREDLEQEAHQPSPSELFKRQIAAGRKTLAQHGQNF